MSAAAALAKSPVEGTLPASKYHVTFGRVVTSEWIKFRTVRSTVWTLGATFVVLVGLALLVAATTGSSDPGIGLDNADIATTPLVAGTGFGQLVLAVLGALTITGEYSTGMIRSTFSAVPTRTPALVAKAVVVVIASFVVAAVSTVVAVLIVKPIFSGTPHELDFGNDDILRVVVGVPLYLAATALLALAFGILIRSSAGSIFAVIGLVLVVGPILANIPVHWLNNIADYLPSQAGQQLLTIDPSQGPAPWFGFIVMVAWGVVLFGIGVFLAKKRDA
ncbi:ABC transporter permease [Luteimicrobium album]|uniref:ABC transporter permease n=1 Tax=Luteimicrobium album TaxID=1054550 RepID=A0ABQ6I2G0_9MICO|nr:ABC transporter permease subunit [Luteimicrobium album]GMA24955.1 ABC transporter permease [Luteimicrobium album]